MNKGIGFSKWLLAGVGVIAVGAVAAILVSLFSPGTSVDSEFPAMPDMSAEISANLESTAETAPEAADEVLYLQGTVVVDEEADDGREKYQAFLSSEELLKLDPASDCMMIMKRKMEYSAEYEVEMAGAYGKKKDYGKYTEINDRYDAPVRIDFQSKRIIGDPERKNTSWVSGTTTLALLTGNVEEADEVKGDAELCVTDFYLEGAELDAAKGIKGERSYKAQTPGGIRISGKFTFNYRIITREQYENLTKNDLMDPDLVFQDVIEMKNGLDNLVDAANDFSRGLEATENGLSELTPLEPENVSEDTLEELISKAADIDADNLFTELDSQLDNLYNCSDTIDDMVSNFDNSSGVMSGTSLMEAAYGLTASLDSYTESVKELREKAVDAINGLSRIDSGENVNDGHTGLELLVILDDCEKELENAGEKIKSLSEETSETLSDMEGMSDEEQKASLLKLMNEWEIRLN